jgi:parvulin-like peptidyl-prolyl isomerase
MTAYRAGWVAACALIVVGLASGRGTADELPTVKGKKVVASVQGETITLSEFDQQLAAMKRAAPGVTVDRSQELALLGRMVNMVLFAQEARRMGLDKLPEIRKAVDSNARVTLRDELVERVVKDVKADAAEVDKIYRASVREWKISAALFEKEEHARSMAGELGAGKNFVELARTYLEQGKATKVEDGVFLARDAMDPEIGKAVSGMALGSTSPVISTRSGLVILMLEDMRYPDNPAERARAEQIVLTGSRKEAVTAFEETLKKKYAKINRELFNSIDYESDTPGIEALLKDRRVLVEVKGEPPVTVGELTEALKFQFFHGTSMAAERKKLNPKKEQVLDGMLHRKLFRKEALRLGLDKTGSYRGKIKEFEVSSLFDAFLRRVIAPGIRLREEDVKAYYDEHRGQYTTPEMIRINSLVFSARKDAETAVESLKQGADFQWVSGQANGQVDPNAKGVMTFDGRPIMTSELPEGVQKAVAGANAGDVRLYAAPEKYVYVLAIQGVVPAQPEPYEKVRRELAEKTIDVKMQKAVEEYAEKLRSLSDVKVYVGS